MKSNEQIKDMYVEKKTTITNVGVEQKKEKRQNKNKNIKIYSHKNKKIIS